MKRDADRLLEYVTRYFSRVGDWPTVRRAGRSLRWTFARIEQAVEDHEHLGLQSYYTFPEEPLGVHEIHSTAEVGDGGTR